MNEKSIEIKLEQILVHQEYTRDKVDDIDKKLDTVKEDTDLNTKFREDNEEKIAGLPQKFPCISNKKRENPLMRIGVIESIAVALIVIIGALGTIFSILKATGKI